uniref:Uncharacterized protein n=1 Tax=Anguilla anguilla TaxID=7936 RepID=A0A0E9XUP5_ANGAN
MIEAPELSLVHCYLYF